MPKSLVSGQPFFAVFRRISGSERFGKEGEGVSRVSVESFLSHSSEKLGRGTTLLCCFSESFWQRKSLENSGREYQKFQSKVFCVTVPKNLLGKQPFCAVFQKICGSEKSLEKKREYQEFSWKVFYLTVPKNLESGQPFYAVFRRNSGSERFEKEGEGVSKVSVQSFLFHSAEKFGKWTTLLCCVSENFWQRTFWKRGGRSIKSFSPKFFISQCRTIW